LSQDSEEISTPGPPGPGFTAIALLLFVAAVVVATSLVSLAGGTVIVAAVQVVAGWLKLPALHLLVATVGAMVVVAILGATILLGADLREVRNALHGMPDHPYGVLGRLLAMGMAEAIDAGSSRSRPRRRAKRKAPE
jgi:hypothetical protein